MFYIYIWLPWWLRLKKSACSGGDLGSIPGSGEGNGNPFWYPYLEDSMDRGAWQATVHDITQSQT